MDRGDGDQGDGDALVVARSLRASVGLLAMEWLVAPSTFAASEAAVEIGHEALIRQWPWLQTQIAEAAPAMRVLARLADAADTWRDGGRRGRLLPNEADRRAFQKLRRER